MHFVTNLFLIIIIFSLSACSFSSQQEPQPEIIVKEEVSSQDSPLILKVKDIKSNNGGTFLEAQVQAKTDWDISRATLNFSVFKEGNLADSIVKYIKDFNLNEPSTHLKKDQAVNVSLHSEIADITDYQLSLGWGEEAEVLKEESLEIGSVKLVNMGADPECVSYECKHFYAIEAVIKNLSNQPISAIELQLNLIDIKSNSAVVEQLVSLNPIEIAPKGQQQIRLKINQTFSSGLSEQLRAQLKVISSK